MSTDDDIWGYSFGAKFLHDIKYFTPSHLENRKRNRVLSFTNLGESVQYIRMSPNDSKAK